MVKVEYGASRPRQDPRAALEAERERLAASITRMKKQLADVEKKLAAMGKE